MIRLRRVAGTARILFLPFFGVRGVGEWERDLGWGGMGSDTLLGPEETGQARNRVASKV